MFEKRDVEARQSSLARFVCGLYNPLKILHPEAETRILLKEGA